MAKKTEKKTAGIMPKSLKAMQFEKPFRQGQKKIEARQSKAGNKAAYVIVFVATFLLLVNGLTMIFLRKEISSLLGQFGYVVETMNIVTFGSINLFLGAMMWLTLHEIEKRKARSQMWFLFVLGVLSMIFGGSLLALVSGILATIAAVFYLYFNK